MRWFGENWGAPVNDACDHAPTPAGEECFVCIERIEVKDNGLLIPVLTGSANPAWIERAAHYACFVDQLIGARLPGLAHG